MSVAVAFHIDEDDEEHFWWGHDCQGTRELWDGKTDDETREHFARGDLRPHRFPLGGDGWTVVKKDPLTIRPSILCTRCHLHGWITNGQWVNV